MRVGFTAILEERNYVLARKIRASCLRGWWAGEACGNTSVVAVMGLAHVNGVRALLGGNADIEMALDLPQRKPRGGEAAPLDLEWPDESWRSKSAMHLSVAPPGAAEKE